MPYRNVCRRGRSAGGRVRQDDVHLREGETARNHDAQAPSPGIIRFVQQVVRSKNPPNNNPPKPDSFPVTVEVQTYPGRGRADVHFEGRAADVFIKYRDQAQRVFGDWLFDYCVANCVMFKIQGVIYGDRQWFSEMNGGRVFPRGRHDHYDHVHIELNCDGANLT